MEILVIIGFVLFATLSVFGFIDLILKINKLTELEKKQNEIWEKKLEEESKKMKLLSEKN